MDIGDAFVPPTVTDADICRASRLLGLPVDAFYGPDGIDPRQEVLKCMGSVDVAACPGSGKTTLLVAKLAILAEKWQYGTRGICVLSHTNAARHEIERHLGNTSIGRRLLGYPHYIGTIHGFVNEFLALPQLRSKGYGNTRFDSDISAQKILKLSSGGRSLPGYLYRMIANEDARIQAVSHAHYISENLDICLHSGNVNLILKRVKNSEAFKKLNKWKLDVLRDGFASYEDTFAYGHKALQKYPMLTQVICARFPMLFIDEAQDNSKEQSTILSRIFMKSDSSIIRQRFGDANQAIFDFLGAEEAIDDKFPSGQVIGLPNSHRFGQMIADLADPLGVQPYPNRLRGVGPKKSLASGVAAGQHTVFLLEENSADKVFHAYGALLLETFSDVELSHEWFSATAVGQVHRPPEDGGADNCPHHLGHYWADYLPELSKQDPKPHSFIHYVLAGQGKSELKGESHAMVEKIAEGILRLSDFGEGGKYLARRQHSHRHVLQLLEATPQTRKQYQDLVVKLTLHKDSLSIQSWHAELSGLMRGIAEVLVGSNLSDEANKFLAWGMESTASVQPPAESRNRNNVFSYREKNREVSIHAGSIHSVKGQTHTATLVLETSWHGHNLEHVLPWFTGSSQGWKSGDGPHQKSRLKLHYVAMTRPTHLLCLAMKRSTLNAETEKAIQTRGWRLVQVQPDGNTVLLKPM